MAVSSVIFAAMGLVALAFIVKIFVDDWRDLQGRGEVADVPDFDEHADMAMRQVLAGRDLNYGRRAVEAAARQFADDVENWMKEQVR